MKFLNLLLLASIATLICACEKNFQSEMLSEGQQTSQTHVQPGILSFSSIEEMENQIRALIEMESDDREAWYAKRNFESQYDALYRAAEEIDRAATLSDAEAIKEKYREFFFTMIIRKMRSCLILTCLMKNRAMPMSAIFVEKYKSVMRSIISIRLRMSEIPKNSSGFMKLKHEA